MAGWFAALQPLLVGAVLGWAGTGKLFGRGARGQALRTALVPLLGARSALTAYRLVGGAELAVGAALLLPPALPAEPLAAAVLAAGFLGYLGYARVRRPGSSCGCLGSRSVPVSWRSFARAGLLLAAGLLALGADGGWFTAVTERPAAAAGVLLLEAAAVVALSPELDRAWLVPWRRLRTRLAHPLAASRGVAGVPLTATLQQLQHSGSYRRVAGLLRSDVVEHWDEGPWRILCYSARSGARPTTAVFAVPLRHYDPAAVRVALVDEPDYSEGSGSSGHSTSGLTPM